ncbi:MAG TPA: hypothetical protein VF605_09490 [Allosphingosinicella sp.]|jgi:hypothetical protein
MDVEIGEVTSEVTAFDLTALKAEILAEVLRRVEEDRRLQSRLDSDRRMRDGATDRPDEVA